MSAVRSTRDDGVYQLLRGIAPPGLALRGARGSDTDGGGRPMDVLDKEVKSRRISVGARRHGLVPVERPTRRPLQAGAPLKGTLSWLGTWVPWRSPHGGASADQRR